MALDAGVLIFVAYPKDDILGTPLGTLTKAYRKTITVEDNAIGAGSFAIHPDDTGASWCTQDVYIAVWRDTVSGDPIAGFWIDTISEVVLTPDEDGGKEIKVSGRGPIAILEEAIVWHKAKSGTPSVVYPAKGEWRWKDAHPARPLVRLLEEAQERGALADVTWDFTRTTDSDGNAWTTDLYDEFGIAIGTNLLDVVRVMREAGLHITMDAGLVLHAWESYTNDLSATIGFTEGVDIRDTSEIEAAARRGKSAVLVQGENRNDESIYYAVVDSTIETALGRRKEAYFGFQKTATSAILKNVGTRKLERWKVQYDGPFTLGVIDTTDQVALVDYTVGDIVAVPTDFASGGKARISGITLTEIDNGEYDPTIEFGELSSDSSMQGGYPSGDTEGVGCCEGTGGVGNSPKRGNTATGGCGDCHPTDPGLYPLDGFDRTTGTEDATDGGAFVWVEDLGYREQLDYAGALVNYTQVGSDVNTDKTGSTVGSVAYPWTSRPAGSACGGLSFTYGDARHQAIWSKFTVPAHATSAAGVKVTLDINTLNAWSAGKLVAVYAKSSAPAYADRGTYVTSLVLGAVGLNSYTFTIQQAAIPAEAGTLWVGLEPESKADEGSEACGYQWPYFTGAGGTWKSNPDTGNDWTMTWQTSGDEGWGAIPEGQGEDTEAPWDGGNGWAVSGSNVTFAVNGTAGTMTATADDVTGTARLAAADDDSVVTDPWGPWSGGRGLFKVLFSVDPIGDTADAAQNTLTISVAGDGWRGAVIVHLGDNVAWSHMDPDQQRGLVVKQGDSSPSYSDFVAKTLAGATPYYVLFDTRGETIRAKIWAASAAEPNDWDIEVARSYEAVTGNWFDIIFDANDGMVLTVESIEAGLGIPPGSVLGRHVIGYGDGSTVTFSTLSPFTAGTLTVWVDGIPVAPSSYDASAGTFTLSRAPYGDPADETGSAVVEAQYEAA